MTDDSNGKGRPLAIRNARLLDPASGRDEVGDLLIVDGAIADLGPKLFQDAAPEGARTIDAGDFCLAPGLVDMRAQVGEPGEEHKETIGSASAAAAASGITTLVALPNTDPVVDDVASVEFVARRAREVKLVKVFTYAALTVGLEGKMMTEFGLLSDYGALGFTDGVKAVADAQLMRRALAYARFFDKPIIQHPEEPSLAGGVMNGGELATRLGLSGIPPVAEVMLVERDLRLVELTGGRYHVAHVSTGETVEVIRRAKARGLPVTCETAPHYFLLNEQAVGDYRTFAKVSPPLRGEDDRQAIVAGLADGTIDAIASDHCPQDQESKRLPFAAAEFGLVGLESLLPLSLELVHKGTLGLLDCLGHLTHRPADILGLKSGRLAKGAAADLVLFDLDRPWRLDPDSFLSRSKNSPFEGHPVQGQVAATLVDGRMIFQAPGFAGSAE